MDRLSGDLENCGAAGNEDSGTSQSSESDTQSLLEQSQTRLSIPEALLQLKELEVLYDARHAALWTFMRPEGRPSFTPPMLGDFEAWQQHISSAFGPDKVPLRYLILGSRSPGVFCFGGDLALFSDLIRAGDRDALVHYGVRCVEILNRNIHALDLPLVTIGLVQGQALGGGFEALLSFDFIIAEKGSKFGLPEIAFGLFPGMGAHPFLSRKLGTAMAERLIFDNRTYSAEEMYELGIVHELAEPGEGIEAVRGFVSRSERRHAGLVNGRRAMRVSSPIAMEEFYEIVNLWADVALQLREQDLKMMQRLASAQEKLRLAS
jgi:DSF synthase